MKHASASCGGRTVVPEVRVAVRLVERIRGLIGESALAVGCALLLPRCRAVHTFFMKFSLDLVFLDSSGVIVRFKRNIHPGCIQVCLAARHILEAQAGWLGSAGIREGERLVFNPESFF